ncbi:MAG: C39 family peptidase [Lachnospiraceae bacterium]|nr:C39 family peptidase [Clostridiales bacterium]MDD6292940.1 C39 family peptidase [Eubacteriales bacterium]MDY2606988.1 C39 family peptidase [Lachnospiraceae bacterium]
MNKRKSVRRRKRRIKYFIKILLMIIMLITACYAADKILHMDDDDKQVAEEIQNLVVSSRNAKQSEQLDYIMKNKDNYTTDLIELAKRNSEAIQFVYDYLENKDKKIDISIDEDIDCRGVPLFMQWDERWGYDKYGDGIIGINGCGPTCLSMVATYILKNNYMNPEWMANFSEESGYVSDSGTLWALMSSGARKLGLESIEIPLDENRVYSNLEVGNPIICSVGPGDFTTEGHFIVLAGLEDGKIIVNDPNSRKNSKKRWTFDEIKGQIKNLWVFR